MLVDSGATKVYILKTIHLRCVVGIIKHIKSSRNKQLCFTVFSRSRVIPNTTGRNGLRGTP